MSPVGDLVGPFPEGADPEEYDRLRRRVLWTMPSGLYLLGTNADGRRNLMTMNLVTQVAMSPKLLGVAVERAALTHELISASSVFALSILRREDRAIVRKFVKPSSDDRAAMTLNEVAYRDAPVSGAPVLASALAYVDCRVERALAYTSHSLFIGEVIDAGFFAEESDEVLRMEDTRMSYGG